MNIVFLYLYLLAAIVIGCLCIRKIKTAADYYVAGRHVVHRRVVDGVAPLNISCIHFVQSFLV